MKANMNIVSVVEAGSVDEALEKFSRGEFGKTVSKRDSGYEVNAIEVGVGMDGSPARMFSTYEVDV